MKIAIASDHRGVEYKKEIIKYLKEKGNILIDCSKNNTPTDDYPDFAFEVCNKVISKEAEIGILVCRTGIGMSIVANKFKGIRCASCHNENTAKYAKLHNNSNILAIGADAVTTNEAICILRMWLATEYEGGRHEERLKIIEEIESKNMK